MADADDVRSLQLDFLKENEVERRAEFWPVIGWQELADGEIESALPLLPRDGKPCMRPELADDLRRWLVEPDFARAQRRPLELDRDQRRYAEGRTRSGYRRIRGAAGSGKSLVLAARAAKLIDEGKDVLIVTYNMTLWHFLRDLVVRARKGGPNPGNLTFTHFHDWCGDVCWNNGFADQYAEIMAPITSIKKLKLPPRDEAKRLRPILPSILNLKIPELALRAARHLSDAERYDAIC